MAVTKSLLHARRHQALGRCWCGYCHSIVDAIAMNVTCQICNDAGVVAVSGPDSFGMYETDDCECQLREEVPREEEADEEEVVRTGPFGRAVESYKYLEAAIGEHNPSHVFGLFSGGRDSLCATSVASAHPRFTAAVFIDTGTAIPETVEFVHETCREQGWSLKVYKGTDSYRDLVLRVVARGASST